MSELHVTRKDGSRHVILYDAADARLVESRSWYIKIKSLTPPLFYAYSQFRHADGSKSQVSMHAYLMGRTEIDHINHNGLDNQRSNLRPATRSQNAANMRLRPGGTSEFRGVGRHKGHRKWTARIRVDGHQTHLGYFETEEAAAKAYDQAARSAFGEFASLNFPEVAHA